MFSRKDTPSPTLSEHSAKDGRHCDLCGSPSPAVRCDKCGGHCFCLSCDDMYHRHPKRKSHQRKAADSVVPGSGPGVTRRPTAVPGDPSKMPIPPPRKKKGKSIFSGFSGPGNEVPALPKKEFSLTEKLGSIRRFMSNRPLPPIPKDEDGPIAITAARRSSSPRMPGRMAHQQGLERQGHSPKSKTPSDDGYPSHRPTSPQYQNILSHLTKLAQSSCEEWEEEPSTSGSARGSSGGEDGWGQDTRSARQLPNPPPLYPRGRGQDNQQWSGSGTLRRGQAPFLQQPSSGFVGPGMHFSNSASDLSSVGLNPEGTPGQPLPGYPYLYPGGVPPLYPQFAQGQTMGRPNYPYWGSWSNIRNKGTDADEENEEDEAEGKRSTLTRRRHSESKMKRSQSVMYDPSIMPPGAFFPFGGVPAPGFPGFAPGFPYWAPQDAGSGQTPPSPSSSSHRSGSRSQGRTRRRQADEDSSSSYAGGGGGSGTGRGHARPRRRQENTDGDLSSEEEQREPDRSYAGTRGGTNPGTRDKNLSGASTPRGDEKIVERRTAASPTSNPGSNPGHNPGQNHGSNPGHNPGPDPSVPHPPNPGPVNVPNTTWECEFCTFINPAGSRICSICCKTISAPHHDEGEAQPMEAKKDINMTEISDEIIKEQERIEKEIRRQIDVKQKLSEESPGEQAQETIPAAVAETPTGEARRERVAATPPPPPPPARSPTPPKPIEPPAVAEPAKVEIASSIDASPQTQPTGVEIETQTEAPQADDKKKQDTSTTTTTQSEKVSTQTQSESPPPPTEPEKQQFPKILSPSRYDSSCQTSGDLPGYRDELPTRTEATGSNFRRSEAAARVSPVQRGEQVEMGTSPPPEDFFSPPAAEETEPYFRREAFGPMQRSLSQTSLNADREYRRTERFVDDGFAPLTRSLSRGSLASEPGTGGYAEGQSTRSGRGHRPAPFLPVGSGPRNLYTSDWNLHRRTDWDDDGFRHARSGSQGPWQGGNLKRRKSEYFLEELAERRRQEKMRSEGLEMVRLVRKAEQAGFLPDDLQVALANCGDQDPVDWLEENWRNMIETVATLATNYGHDKPDNDVGLVSAGEARSALRMHRGNIWAAVTECVENRQKKYLDIQSRANFSRREIITALTAHQGDTELAYQDLLQKNSRTEPERGAEKDRAADRRFAFLDQRLPDQTDKSRLNVRPELRRSSLVEQDASQNFPGRNESRRFSYSAGFVQPGPVQQAELFGAQRANDFSDSQSITSEDVELMAAGGPSADDDEVKRDRLSMIKRKRDAQKDVKRSSSFLDKLSSLRKDKKQERKPNESRFLRYGSLNVLDVDTSGLRQSSFEEAMSGDFEPPTETQPQKKGFFSRLLNRSSETDLRAAESREGQAQMFDYPFGRMTQEYPVMMDQAAINKLLSETSAIEKVRAYLNQIPSNNYSPATSVPQTSIATTVPLITTSPPPTTVYPQSTTAQPLTTGYTTQPLTTGFVTNPTPQIPSVFQQAGPTMPTAGEPAAMGFQNVFPGQQPGFPDVAQFGEMLEKLGLMSQLQAATAQQVTTTAAPGFVQPEQAVASTVFTPQAQADVPRTSPSLSPQQVIPSAAQSTTPVTEQFPNGSEAASGPQDGTQNGSSIQRVNNNSLKAQWLGVSLEAPLDGSENIAPIEPTVILTGTADNVEKRVKPKTRPARTPSPRHDNTTLKTGIVPVDGPRKPKSPPARTPSPRHDIVTLQANYLPTDGNLKPQTPPARTPSPRHDNLTARTDYRPLEDTMKPQTPPARTPSPRLETLETDHAVAQSLLSNDVRDEGVLGEVGGMRSLTPSGLTQEVYEMTPRSYDSGDEQFDLIDPQRYAELTQELYVDTDHDSYLSDEQLRGLSSLEENSLKPTVDDDYKEIRGFFVGPAVIKKGTSLELEPEEEDDYLEGDSVPNGTLQTDSLDVPGSKNLLSVPQPSPTQDYSSSYSETESTEYTDGENQEKKIAQYVQSIVTDNLKIQAKEVQPYKIKRSDVVSSDHTLPLQPPTLLPSEEEDVIPPMTTTYEAVPDTVALPTASAFVPPTQVAVESTPITAPASSAVVPELTNTSEVTVPVASTKLAPTSLPTPVIEQSDSEPLNIPQSPIRRRRSNRSLSGTRVSPRKEEPKKTTTKEEPKPAELSNSITTSKSAEPQKQDSLKSAEAARSARISQAAELRKAEKQKSAETVKPVPSSARAEPGKPAKAVDDLKVVQEANLTTTSGSTKLRRQRSISRDRRPAVLRTESTDAASKDSVVIRRRSSAKTDTSSVSAKGEPTEAGRKSLKDTKKLGTADSKLDRYRKSAKSPEKQSKSPDSQSAQNGAIMSAKRLALDNRVKELLDKAKCESYEQAEMAARLMEMNFMEAEAIQASKECGNLYQAISFLQQDCELCAGKFPVAEMVSMIHCTHRACRECLKAYFSIQIRDRNILELKCPYCSEPDLTDDDKAADYFNHMDLMLKNLVEPDIHELFHCKLRDRTLMKDPNFRWCSQCSSGFIINNPNQKRLLCPDCKAVTCASCRKLWEKQHEGISCQQFQEWKEANDPELQAAGLAQHLAENGIDCPNCRFRYSLAKGGCMHFRCLQCQYDFCSGCSKPFKMGQKCGVSDFCAKLGLHAHHPRNCLFYLRDKEPEELQKLLDQFEISYNKSPPAGADVKKDCQVMEQKETPSGLLDDICGKDICDGFAGLCRLHYTEFLVELINRHSLDPLPILDVQDMQCILRRGLKEVPQSGTEEAEETYRMRLVQVIKAEMPLERIEGS